jgi:cytochrome c oxidase subunit 2
MNAPPSLGLPQASSLAPQVDRLFDAMLALCGAVALGVFVVMIVFCVRYRRGSRADRSGGQGRTLGIELTWTLLPFLLFVGIFGWSIVLWARLRTPPREAMTVYVVAKQWMWHVQHPGGQREIDRLHVPVGVPVRLVMTSQDVIHSFDVPAFRVKQDVLPGRYTELWFTVTRAGRYPLFCAEYCGAGHAAMLGSVEALPAAAFARWLEGGAADGLAARGRELFRRYGCSGCHASGAAVHTPPLEGVYGSTVPLDDGSTVIADETYLHDSIMLPRKQVVAGYAPIMPAYQGRIGEEDVLALVAYLKSLRHGEADGRH